MNLVFRTFLNLLLAVSLAAAPVTASIASVKSTVDQTGGSLAMTHCHQAGQAQAPADTQTQSPATADQSCCDVERHCPGLDSPPPIL